MQHFLYFDQFDIQSCTLYTHNKFYFKRWSWSKMMHVYSITNLVCSCFNTLRFYQILSFSSAAKFFMYMHALYWYIAIFMKFCIIPMQVIKVEFSSLVCLCCSITCTFQIFVYSECTYKQVLGWKLRC